MSTPAEMKKIEEQFIKLINLLLAIEKTMSGVPGEVEKYAEALAASIGDSNKTNHKNFTATLTAIMLTPTFQPPAESRALTEILKTSQGHIDSMLLRAAQKNQVLRVNNLTEAKQEAVQPDPTKQSRGLKS